jgi:hypothetical protein
MEQKDEHSELSPDEIQTPTQNDIQRDKVFFSIGYLLHKTADITAFSFETAKTCTKIGLGVTKEVIDAVGRATGLETPSYIVKSTVEVAEWIALTSVETARFWTDFGVGAARQSNEARSFKY